MALGSGHSDIQKTSALKGNDVADAGKNDYGALKALEGVNCKIEYAVLSGVVISSIKNLPGSVA